MNVTKTAAVLGLAYGMAFFVGVRAQQPAGDGPRYAGTALVRPAEYREWVFLSSGLGMNYNAPSPGAPPPTRQFFTNVFVNPSSHRSFMQTGKWPDKTMLVLEIRASSGDGSINKAGRFQTTVAGMEVHVKDARFPDGWAFFNFAGGKDVAEPLSGENVAPCVACHVEHAAVERTFGQFYPTILDAARRMGTLKPGF